MTTRPDTETRLATLDTRMTGLEDSLKLVIAKLDSKGHFPVGTLLSAAAIFGGGLLWVVTTQTAPLSKEVDRTGALLDKVSLRLEVLTDKVGNTFVSRADLDKRFESLDGKVGARFDAVGSRRDDWQRNAEERDKVTNAAIDKLRDTMREDVVSRGEHLQHWSSIDRQFADQQRQLDDQRSRMNELYSAKDVIRDDHAAIQRLELDAASHRP